MINTGDTSMLGRSESGLAWMSSNGGPLLLVPGEYLSSWGGVCPPTDGRRIEATFRWDGPDSPACDYDRACDVDGYLALLEIGAGQGLVLGGDPMSTAWWPITFGDSLVNGGGILIRWFYANSDADVMAAVERVPEAAWVDDGLALVVGQAPLYLMDSTSPGGELGQLDKLGTGDDHLTIDLPAGCYALATAIVEPVPHTSLVLHRLKPVGDSTTVDRFERD
jgi:immunity protein 21 of polymorphic toxin system